MLAQLPRDLPIADMYTDEIKLLLKTYQHFFESEVYPR